MTAALTLRVVAGQLELRCRRGLTLTQGLRDPIAERCPKCLAAWGRDVAIETTPRTT